jgi:hypothetical protein
VGKYVFDDCKGLWKDGRQLLYAMLSMWPIAIEVYDFLG